MAYALDRHLFIENGPTVMADRALEARRVAADQQRRWRHLSPDQRWALASEALGIAA